MAYDEHLGERISKALKEKRVRYEAKDMIGGLCFMINDKMAVGVVNDSLLARIDPDIYQISLKKGMPSDGLHWQAHEGVCLR
jgi:TfoX/Sxy family transcriptional regulator of competence genes